MSLRQNKNSQSSTEPQYFYDSCCDMPDELLDVVLVCETNAIGDRSVSGPTPLQPDIPICKIYKARG